MELTKTFTDDQFRQALESWAWLGLDGKKPVFASLFGDVFFEASDGWWYLDTVEGTLTRRWTSEAELRTELASPDGQEQLLRATLAAGAAARGVTLQANDVYGFNVPPILGGLVNADNVESIDYDVAQTLAGQLREQTKDLPPGTRVRFRMDEDVAPPPSRKRWFRR